jgi:hypothetical protein
MVIDLLIEVRIVLLARRHPGTGSGPVSAARPDMGKIDRRDRSL